MLSKLPFGISDSDIDADVCRLFLTQKCLLTTFKVPVDIDDTCTDQGKIRQLQLKQAAGTASHDEGVITTVMSP